MELLNLLYTGPSSPALQDHIKMFSRPHSTDAINNMYKHPIIE